MDPTIALQRYRELLLSWSAKVNLVGPEARANIDEHIAEALEAAEFLKPSGEVLDFGSGGGLPAIPMAISAGSAARFHLVEADIRKWSFLKFAARECELKCLVYGDRLQRVIPALDPALRFDLVTSRAVGHPEDWVPLVKARLSSNGRVALFQAGREAPAIEGMEADVSRLSRGDHNFLVTLRCST